MPGTTRYSATFDCPYEEDDRPASEPPNGTRRSRSHSLQANMGSDSRPYTPLGNNRPFPRSSSTDSGSNSGAEHIPTRTVSKPAVKTHNNPFQFVKVGSCSLYKSTERRGSKLPDNSAQHSFDSSNAKKALSAEEQLKKVKEVKKPDVLKEEEEEWQSNLDSWKSRRRKMSEDVFRRQEEIRQFEQEEQNTQAVQRKIKTFSEMVESRANRGRTLSLCLISSPLELQEWETDNSKSNSSHPFSEGSEENSAVNSEDEGVGDKRSFQKNLWSNGTNENNSQLIKNGATNTCKNKANESSYADSGLESISSSHRMGDTPDSCSDFSQDSGSSIDCDSPRVSGLLLNSVNLLENFNSKSLSSTECDDAFVNLKTANINKEKEINDTPMSNGKIDSSLQDSQNIPKTNNNSKDVCISNEEKVCKNNTESCDSKFSFGELENSLEMCSKQEKSVESENEVFVDDFEELSIQSKIFEPNSPKKATAKIVSMEISNEKMNLSSNQKVVTSPQIKDESLNIVFQSQPSNNKDSVNGSSSNSKLSHTSCSEKVVLSDVPPVEKIAEEMEKLILQQLEEEERAKEMSLKTTDAFGSTEHNFIAPPKVSEPPKEKPPPPPVAEDETLKATPLKRVNSTKRIKKEIHKRRSNFLGIEADENVAADENCIPPPPALEQILKVEVELEKENRKRLESAADERLRLEENEIIEKEQEIIANLESEEKQKQLFNNAEMCTILQEEERIQKLKEERKTKENERLLAETQRLRLEEEKQLREREKFVRKQEADNAPSVEISAPALSDAANLSINQKSPNASLCSDTKPNVSLSGNSGEGKILSNSSQALDIKSNEMIEKKSVPVKPDVPPKPLKR
ncbi:LIM and calponin y domains-containing protein 1 [Caerostris extrusa]|uniref:LIM and calponin y domains-containing protein 1 n=1 Tax=Caerostris extrusa TaxID=172846 RepID=A0AAV4MLB5_CAEEX|nr:LIM and calponin y domains-containing protein 1 [Caerostris extrusa]